MVSEKLRAFTLIELLIVVAIIAILAAIAVPNFLEAQVRAKVTRCKNDMRTSATALEAYKVDANHYPLDSYGWVVLRGINIYTQPDSSEFFVLTTPLAYMTSVPRNVFPNISGGGSLRYPYVGEENHVNIANNYRSDPHFREGNEVWIIYSMGPDMRDSQGQCYLFGLDFLLSRPPLAVFKINAGALYDATNGTISNGDLCRVGP